MGRQLNFHATAADVAELEARIRKLEPMAVLHARSTTAKPRVLPSLSFVEGAEPLLFYYLVREHELPKIVTAHVPAQGYWAVDVLRSPAVQFHGCYLDNKILRRGRVYYVDGFYNQNGTWVEKSESFRLWAGAVLNAVRKSLKKHGPDYIGRDASTWLQREGGSLLMWGLSAFATISVNTVS